jgi:hypothetical protein
VTCGTVLGPEIPSLVISAPEEGLPTRPDDSRSGVNVWNSAEGELCAFSLSDGDRHWLHWPGVASFHFTPGDATVTAVPYLPVRDEVIRTTFHHSVLPLVLQALGREGLHASAVVTTKGVVGFSGKAHTGKSTLAYAMSKRGFPLWSDDALVWQRGAARFDAVRLPFEPKLRPPALSFFGHQSIDEVRALRVQSAEPTERLAAICVLSRKQPSGDSPAVTVERICGGRAMMTLLDHAHCFNPSNAIRKRQMMLNYLSLLDCVPIFEVRFEPSLLRIFGLVDTIVDAVL